MKALLSIIGFIMALYALWILFIAIADIFINRPKR